LRQHCFINLQNEHTGHKKERKSEILRKKLLILAVISVMLIAIPLAIAAVTNSTTISVKGTANYPNLPATPDPTTAPVVTEAPASASFSLSFLNGTAVPSTLTPSSFADFPTYTMWQSPTATGFGSGWMPTALDTLVVTNTGNVPITISAAASNVNVPSNIDLSFQYEMLTSPTGSPTTSSIAPGQTQAIMFMTNMAPTNTNYASNAAFSYSFDITVTATQT
jgi:hypothetical protein